LRQAVAAASLCRAERSASSILPSLMYFHEKTIFCNGEFTEPLFIFCAFSRCKRVNLLVHESIFFFSVARACKMMVAARVCSFLCFAFFCFKYFF
jgi:hypothetical protein